MRLLNELAPPGEGRTLLAAPARHDVLRGIGFMLAGMFLFAVNDSLGKHLLGRYAVGELMLVRGAAGLAVMLPLLWRAGLPLLVRGRQPGLQWLRFALSPAEAGLFFWALATLPLAEVMTYYQAGPIWATAISAFVLRERVGWRRWAAVGVGFAGAGVALHPAGGLSLGAGSALLGSVLYAGFLVATARLPAIPRPVLMAQQLVATLLFGAAIVPFQGWAPPGPLDFGLMLALGFGSLAANLCVNMALRLGPAASIVPFQYTMLPWGIALGYLLFGTLPGLAGLAGAVVIVAAGLFIVAREQRLAAAG